MGYKAVVLGAGVKLGEEAERFGDTFLLDTHEIRSTPSARALHAAEILVLPTQRRGSGGRISLSPATPPLSNCIGDRPTLL